MGELIKLFIGGEWLSGGGRETIPVINPATEETVAELCMADESDLEHALAAAQRGFIVWRNIPAAERAFLLHKTAGLMRERIDVIGRALTLEQGKTLAQAKGEVAVTAAYFDELAECGVRIADRLLPAENTGIIRTVVHEPIGPVFAVSPWNLPAMMPGRKIGTSLAAGCSIIVKPAKETPQTAYLIGQCCQDAGIPDGVVNILSGPSSVVSNTLIASPVIRKISFTGSTEVGKVLAATAGEHMKKVTMELGGHAPVIILDVSDMNETVSNIVASRYSNAGQSCMAATRFFVHQDIYSEFIQFFTEKTASMRVGNGLEEGIDMGPLTSARRIPVMEDLVADAVACGAIITTGGKPINRKGSFFEPTVLSDVPDKAKIMSEEPFGPISPMCQFSNIDEVIAQANSTPYGLASYVFSCDIEKARYLASSLEAGLVGINSMNIAGPTVPFGGVKDSGIGREGAMEGVLESMTTKTISIMSA